MGRKRIKGEIRSDRVRVRAGPSCWQQKDRGRREKESGLRVRDGEGEARAEEGQEDPAEGRRRSNCERRSKKRK